MKKINLTLSMLAIAISVAFGQKSYTFKVLAAKGSNQTYTQGKWNTVNAGSVLISGEKIKVIEGGYVGLIHSSGKTMELKSAGTFNVSDLESKVIQSKSNFGEKYGDFVADGMFASNPNANSNFTNTGSATRSVDVPIFVYAPIQIKAIKSEPLTLHWNNCGGNHTFKVTLSDYYGDEIYTTKTTTNSATIDFNKIKLESEEIANSQQSFLLTIQSTNDPSYTSSSSSADANKGHSYSIELVDKNTEATVNANISKIKSQLDPKSAMDYMVLAHAYEKQGLMTYAVDSYAKAKKLAPNIDEFSKQYEEYIKTKLGATTLNGSKGN